MIPLSILDLSVVTTGTRPAAALRNSIDLARHVDGLGYVRYWLAEHHNLASVASPAPDLMIGQIAALTKNIRVGSGGVMLPNHQIGRRAGHRGEVMVLGKPVADVTKRIDMARQIDAVAQRGGGFCACGDDGKVED